MSGYARFHRSLVGHPAFRNDAEAMAFAYLVLRASWQPTRVRYKGKAISLERGQLAVSVRDLADAMDRDKGWVERLLKRLKSEGMCETHAETGVMVVTVCNYDKYQADKAAGETPAKTVRKTAARQTQDTEQGMEKGNKELPLPPVAGAKAGKTRLPADWQVPLVSDLPPKARACAEQWTAASYDTHAEAFGSYWRSEGRMMLDWDATWANRIIALHSQVMRDQKFGNAPIASSNTPAKPMDGDARAAYLAKLDAAPHLRGTNTPEPPRPNGSHRGPRSFAQLAGGIASGAAH